MKKIAVILLVLFGVNAAHAGGDDDNSTFAEKSVFSGGKMGLIMPVGSLSDHCGAGFAIGGLVDIMIAPHVAVGASLELDIFGNKNLGRGYYQGPLQTNLESSVLVLQFAGHVKSVYAVPDSPIQLVAGGGPAFNLDFRARGYDEYWDDSDADATVRLGLNFFGGINIPVADEGHHLSLQTRYHFSPNLAFFEISFAFYVNLGPLSG